MVVDVYTVYVISVTEEAVFVKKVQQFDYYDIRTIVDSNIDL